MLLAAKVNNAPDALRLTYWIEGVELPGAIGTSRVRWGTALTDAAPVAAAAPTAKQTMSAAVARAWLAEQLTGGPHESGKLKAAAAAACVSIPALYRAAASLGVRREPVGGTQRKSWRLPGDAQRKE